MKKLFIIAIALFYASIASAQINTVVVNTSGDVILRQGKAFHCSPSSQISADNVLYLKGSSDYDVTLEELENLTILSSGDVVTDGEFRGKDLSVVFNSSGDSRLDLNYENVNVKMVGNGDLVLRGRCDQLNIVSNGRGDLHTKELVWKSWNTKYNSEETDRNPSNLEGLSELLAELGANLEYLSDSVDWDQFERDMERWGENMEEWGRRMEEWGEQVERQMEGRAPRDRRDNGSDKPHYGPSSKNVPGDHFPGQRPKEASKSKSLLFDPHWGGIDAGLNMLLGNELAKANFNYLELRPLRSWVFNFNIADVGIAFNRNHVAGLYTGIGLGWNNYSFDNPVWLIKGDNNLEYELIDESVEGKLKKSKLGMLYIQAPLMVEVRPTRGFFIAAGLTAGIKVDTWMKIKFMDRYKEKAHGDFYSNLFKLDATLRAGGNDMGFFASYNLLPLFKEGKGPGVHTFNVGFSLIF